MLNWFLTEKSPQDWCLNLGATEEGQAAYSWCHPGPTVVCRVKGKAKRHPIAVQAGVHHLAQSHSDGEELPFGTEFVLFRPLYSVQTSNNDVRGPLAMCLCRSPPSVLTHLCVFLVNSHSNVKGRSRATMGCSPKERACCTSQRRSGPSRTITWEAKQTADHNYIIHFVLVSFNHWNNTEARIGVGLMHQFADARPLLKIDYRPVSQCCSPPKFRLDSTLRMQKCYYYNHNLGFQWVLFQLAFQPKLLQGKVNSSNFLDIFWYENS